MKFDVSIITTVVLAIFTILLSVIGWFIREAFQKINNNLIEIKTQLTSQNAAIIVIETEKKMILEKVEKLDRRFEDCQDLFSFLKANKDSLQRLILKDFQS